MAAVGRSDRPRAADVVGRAVVELFRPLRCRRADRMDRGEVDDVEAERRDVVETVDRVDQCPVGWPARRGSRRRCRRTWKELVPRAEGSRAVGRRRRAAGRLS